MEGAGKYHLLINLPGYGNKGDKVEVVRSIGQLVMVKNGDKQFCVEKYKALSICPVQPQQVQQR